MRLQSRHYLLIAIVLALGVYNLVRAHRTRHSAGSGAVAADRLESPAWRSFDEAAALRDAPEAQFTPALTALRTQTDAAQGADAGDLRNCLMWLQYYRHSVPMASGNASSWGMLATGHVQSCRNNHRDVGQ